MKSFLQKYKLLALCLVVVLMTYPCLPDKYESTVVLASEDGAPAFQGSYSSLSAMLGIDKELRTTDDAISAALYPKVVQGRRYLQMLDGDSTNLHAWRRHLLCSVDEQTQTVTLTYRHEDAIRAALVADSAQRCLQRYIADYRRQKIGQDLRYIAQVREDAQQRYDSLYAQLADYQETHQSIHAEKVHIEEVRLENEANALRLILSRLTRQQQIIEAKLLEEASAFTVLQHATVPERPYNKREKWLIVFALIAGILSIAYFRVELLRWKRYWLGGLALLTLSIGLGIGLYLCLPEQHTARITLADEYRESDLSLALSNTDVAQKLQDKNATDEGINDLETYVHILLSPAFCQTIAEKQGADCSWRDVQRHLQYQTNSHQGTLTLQYTSPSQELSARMLDTIVDGLQGQIWQHRLTTARHRTAHALTVLQQALQEQAEAHTDYADFVDSHRLASRNEVSSQLAAKSYALEYADNALSTALTKAIREEYLEWKTPYAFSVVDGTTPARDVRMLYCIVWMLLLVGLLWAGWRLRKGWRQWLERLHPQRLHWGGLFSPWSITLLVWGILAILFAIFGHLVDPISEQFYLSLSLWVGCFVVVSFVAYHLLDRPILPHRREAIEINETAFNLLLGVVLILSPLFLYRVLQTVAMFDTDNLANNIRLLALHGSGHGFLNYANVIAQSLLLVALWRYPRLGTWKLVLIIGCCIMNSIAIMEKGSFFVVLACSCYVLYERGVLKLRSLLVAGVLTLAIFYLFNIVRQSEQADLEDETSFLYFLCAYIMSPLVAFGKVSPDLTDQVGVNTFETIYLLLNRLIPGYFEVHDKTQEFVFVPVPTNVYTIMQPFFRDFGYAGVALFGCLYGAMSGLLYRLAKSGNALCTCLYTYLVQVLMLQFYQENLFLSMVFVGQLVFFTLLCCLKDPLPTSPAPSLSLRGGRERVYF